MLTKKITKLITFIMIASGLIFSCKKSTIDTVELTPKGFQPAGLITKQLQLSQEKLVAKHLSATIISYQDKGLLANNKDVVNLQQKLIAEDDLIPQYDGVNPASFKVNSIKERMQAYKTNPDYEQDVAKNLQNLVLPLIKTGQQVMSILWLANGKQFTTTCVYDGNGIIYDHMLSNIAFCESENIPEQKLSLSSSNLRTANNSQTEKQYSFSATARNLTIQWAWGATRGKVVIAHYIIWNGSNYIYNSGGTVDAWMTLGSASGKFANNYLSASSLSKMAWGYGWATPTATFSISLSAKYLTFSVGTSGIGSQGSGSGIHTIYMP